MGFYLTDYTDFTAEVLVRVFCEKHTTMTKCNVSQGREFRMRSADEWFEAYGESHQNPTNKQIHWICVPLIFTTVVGLLWGIQLPIHAKGQFLDLPLGDYFNLGSLLLIIALGYYSLISISLMMGMIVVSILSIIGVLALQHLGGSVGLTLNQVSILIFVLAWIGQFVGHKIEGKKPSFLEDLQFLMIGPLWLLGFIYRRFGIRY